MNNKKAQYKFIEVKREFLAEEQVFDIIECYKDFDKEGTEKMIDDYFER